MTYLATEMLLYLLAAAIIGLTMGWLVWGAGQRRKLRSLRNELMATVEAEREAHHETRQALDEARKAEKSAATAARAEADHALEELRRTVDDERQSTAEAHAAVERMRAEMEDAIRAGRATDQDTIDQAIRTASAEKAAAADALAREAQSRAQLEELRLLIGAEKLAAESARNELTTLRAEMETKLQAERAAHEQAKVALDDIRSTLSRTFGPNALGMATDAQASDGAAAPGIEASSFLGQIDGQQAHDAGRNAPSPFSMMADMADAGEALNNPDLDEADSEDREDVNLDLSPTIDPEPVADEVTVSTDGDPDTEEPEDAAVTPPNPIALRPLQLESAPSERPQGFLDQRPDDVDDLQAIDGIDSDIERQLNDAGCYRYRQLAELTPADVSWLSREIDVPAYRIAADQWLDQARALIAHDDADDDEDGPVYFERTDRENAAG